MDGEVVHALLGLLDERVAVDLPAQLLDAPVYLLQRLIEGDGADGHGAIAQDPLARLVDMAACGEVHDGVGAPAGRPDGLLYLLGDAAGDGGVADVGIDLTEEVAADDHGLALGVVDVRWEDGAAAGQLLSDELCRHQLRQHGALGVAAAAVALA